MLLTVAGISPKWIRALRHHVVCLPSIVPPGEYLQSRSIYRAFLVASYQTFAIDGINHQVGENKKKANCGRVISLS